MCHTALYCIVERNELQDVLKKHMHQSMMAGIVDNRHDISQLHTISLDFCAMYDIPDPIDVVIKTESLYQPESWPILIDDIRFCDKPNTCEPIYP